VISFRPSCFTPDTHWIEGWVVPRASLDMVVKKMPDMRFEIFMAVKIQVKVFWVVML
jgi:hypothetical protein